MSEKYQGRYRSESTRLNGWNYNSSAVYHVTINTSGGTHFFGNIEKGKMQLSQIGEIVREEWLNTMALRPDMNLELGEFVVMPNHFHALIHIGVNEFNQTRQGRLLRFPMEQDYPEWKNTFGAQRKNLASIIRGFKSKVTSRVRREKALPLIRTN